MCYDLLSHLLLCTRARAIVVRNRLPRRRCPMARLLLAGDNICDIVLAEFSDQGDPILGILNEFKAGTLGIVAAADKVDAVAMVSGACREMKIDHRLLGVDIANKGGRVYTRWRWLCWPVISLRMDGAGQWWRTQRA